ncbi:MAG: hypothetical protein JW881_16395 [Spirochaetales bacterium]|nr:hypothetical protein [Spirochaetales bacterium]
MEIEKNSNPELILDKNIDGQYIDYFFLGDAYRTDDVISGEYSGNGDDIYILEMYDTFIKFDLSKIEKKYDYSNIEIYYIEDKNFFFISADNYGRLE